MKVIKKVLFIAILAVLSFSIVSCENENIDTSLMKASELEASTNDLNASQVVNDGLIQTRSSYYVSGLPLNANIPYYSHLKEPSITSSSHYGSVSWTCGQTSYLVLRRAIDDAYAKPKKQNVINLHRYLWDQFFDYRNDPDHFASMYHIQWFATHVDNFTFNKIHKEARPLPGEGKDGIDFNAPARTQFKRWLEKELQNGRPVVCPATWNLEKEYKSKPSMGHFFIVIGLDKNNHNQLEIEVIDVLYREDQAKHRRKIPYTDLLNAMWYLNYNPEKEYSGGTYACSFYTGYSLKK